jgi:hypothetical protein
MKPIYMRLYVMFFKFVCMFNYVVNFNENRLNNTLQNISPILAITGKGPTHTKILIFFSKQHIADDKVGA